MPNKEELIFLGEERRKRREDYLFHIEDRSQVSRGNSNEENICNNCFNRIALLSRFVQLYTSLRSLVTAAQTAPT